MPRTARQLDPTGTYHVVIHANNKGEVFTCNNDRVFFLNLLREETKNKTIWLHHYALMSNHVHLIIKSNEDYPLSEPLKRVFQSFSIYHKMKYGHCGHIWRDRYKSFLIKDDSYLITCGIYVELNPLRAGLHGAHEDRRWTSNYAYSAHKADKLITLSPAFLALGDSDQERIITYKYMTKMWEDIGPSKSSAKYFFSGKTKRGTVPFSLERDSHL